MTNRTPQPEMTLLDFFEREYRPVRMIDASKGAAQQYHVAIGRLSDYLGRPATIGDLTEAVVAGWMAAGRRANLAVATVNSRLRMILTLWRFAKRKQIVAADAPDDLTLIEPLREKTRVPTAWSLDELARLLKSCRLARSRFCGIPAAAWWEALILVMYDTGLRRSAVFAIQIGEIDFAEKMLRVPAERMKNGIEQWFRLSDQTIAAILATLPPARSTLFPFTFRNDSAIYTRFRVILRRAGLPFTSRDMFHKIRRTTATHIAAQAGKAAAIRQLGHQDESCINRYIDPSQLSEHDGAKHLPRPGWTAPEVPVVESLPELADQTRRRRVYRVASSLLSGVPADLFADLARQSKLANTDIVSALGSIGLTSEAFAAEVGCTPQHLRQVLRGQKKMGGKLESRIRVVLGTRAARIGETDRVGERRKGGAA
jgi:integrase